jgi:hypothetical protein
MAKGDKQDVARAKAAASKRKSGSVVKAAVGAAKTQVVKNKVSRINRLDAQYRTIVQPTTMGKTIKGSGLSTPGRALTPSEIKRAKAVDAKAQAAIKKLEKSGTTKAVRSTKTGSYGSKKTGAMNKMKAQGAKIGSSATSGYGKTTKK